MVESIGTTRSLSLPVLTSSQRRRVAP